MIDQTTVAIERTLLAGDKRATGERWLESERYARGAALLDLA
jgi:hypothetical protein